MRITTNKFTLKIALTSIAFLVAQNAAFASAFAVNELGVKAQGMGGAFSSIASDASAIFYNPAGLAFQEGLQLEMDNLVVVGLFRFSPSEVPAGTVVPAKGYSGANRLPFIPVANLYMAKKINNRFAFGFGAYTPFGLAVNFTNFNDADPPNTKFVGRWAGTRARLESIWLQPTVAVRLSENQALGLGVALVHTHILLEQSFLNPYDAPNDFGRGLAKVIFPGEDPDQAYRSLARLLPEGRNRSAATSNAPGFSAGYLYKHQKSKTNFAFSARSTVVNHIKGKVAFAFTEGSTIQPFLPKDQTLDTLFRNQSISGTFTTPATYVFGISNHALPNWTLSFDFRIQEFRRFQDLPINFSVTKDEKGVDLPTTPERRIVFDFSNSYIVHSGVERQLSGGDGNRFQRLRKGMAVRAGYMFDHTPVVDKSVGPLFPDANRHGFTVGMSKSSGKMEMSLFYQFTNFSDRDVEVPANQFQYTNGLYHNFAHLAGLGLRMHFDKKSVP